MRPGLWLGIVCALVLLPLTALAKGPPAKATIEGPGIAAPVEITDPALLDALSFFQFEQVEENGRRGIAAPAAPGAGFLITRYVENNHPWDELHYFPNPDGERGTVFLDGLIGPNTTEFDGRWYHASPAGDAAIRGLLVSLGVVLTPPTTLPATGRASGDVTLAVVGWLCLAAGALARARGRTRQLRLPLRTAYGANKRV